MPLYPQRLTANLHCAFPFRGVLLIGGDARLSDLRGTPALGTRSTAGQSSREDLPDLTFLDEGTATELDLGAGQAIHLAMSHPGRCASAYAVQRYPPQFLGQAQIITGHAAAPVLRQWRLGMVERPAYQPELATDRQPAKHQPSTI
jgi:hypothetical protein